MIRDKKVWILRFRSDVIERFRAQEALKESKLRYERAYERNEGPRDGPKNCLISCPIQLFSALLARSGSWFSVMGSTTLLPLAYFFSQVFVPMHHEIEFSLTQNADCLYSPHKKRSPTGPSISFYERIILVVPF